MSESDVFCDVEYSHQVIQQPLSVVQWSYLSCLHFSILYIPLALWVKLTLAAACLQLSCDLVGFF